MRCIYVQFESLMTISISYINYYRSHCNIDYAIQHGPMV